MNLTIVNGLNVDLFLILIEHGKLFMWRLKKYSYFVYKLFDFDGRASLFG